VSGAYDAVVIGAGQNGLVAAAVLARAGRRVLVLERRDTIGGTNHTAEFHPGYRVDAAFHQAGWLDPAMAEELGIGVPADAPGGPDPAVLSPLGDGVFVLPRAPRAAAEALRRFSAADAGRWEAFCTLTHKLAGFLQHLYGVTPPQLTSRRAADLLTLLGLGRRVRGLGKADMIELLRVLPMSAAELLDDWFETDVLKGVLGAAGITGIAQGPRSAGTAFVMLHHQVGSPHGVIRGGGIRPGGAGAMTQRFAAAAQALGVETRTGAAVAQILVQDGRARGVVLESGEEVAAAQVVSTVDPRRTMLGLVDPVELAPEYARAVQHIRCRGVSAKVNLALAELPRFAGAEPSQLRGLISVSPSLDYLERAHDDAKYGGMSRAPYLEAVIPSLAEPALAPPGRHVMSVWMQYAPYRLEGGAWDAAARDALGDRVIECLAQHAPNLRSSIVHREVLTPRDLEDAYGATEGNLYHGEMGLDQVLFMRPVPGWGHYRTPVDNLYLGGSGTHPGGGIAGGAGRLAARAMLAETRTEPRHP
jgi:phytoene dehydrogenase-like protein